LSEYSFTCPVRRTSGCEDWYLFSFTAFDLDVARPPLKICSFPAPTLHFTYGSVGRGIFFFFQNKLLSFTNLVPSKSSNGFCSFKSVNQFWTEILEQYWNFRSRYPVTIKKKRHHKSRKKIFRVAMFSNGQSGAGNKQFFNFGLMSILSFFTFNFNK
jgi:hypothetical protein